MIAALIAFIERIASRPTQSTTSERYWTSVARGL